MKIFFAILVAVNPLLLQAQFGSRLLNKVKNKVDQRVDQKTDKAIDKTLDEAEGKKQPAGAAAPAAGNEAAATNNAPATQSYAAYDFVPGAQVIYSNSFEGEKPGELPTGWNSSGNSSVVTLNTKSGNWVQLQQNAVTLTDNNNAFTENCTVEFDLVFQHHFNGMVLPLFCFGLLNSGDRPANDNSLLQEYKKNYAFELKVQPGVQNDSHMHLQAFSGNTTYLNTEIKRFKQLQTMYDGIHVAMQVQKERLRIWFNGEKLYDLPKAITAGTILNQLYFAVKGSAYNDAQVGFYIGNIKIAKGLPDTRHKLIEEGKFSTTGILFDVNAATIRPESNGVLKEIADVLTKFPDVKVKVIGHTDSDGNDASNLSLSKKRAEAVRQSLISDFAIDAARIETDGKGESQPVGDNKTREGKAANRRVEFIKQ